MKQETKSIETLTTRKMLKMNSYYPYNLVILFTGDAKASFCIMQVRDKSHTHNKDTY